MNCESALPLLYDLIDYELDDLDRPVLEEHLSACPACQQQLASMRAAEVIYRREIIAEPAAELPARIIAAQVIAKPLPLRVRAGVLGAAAAGLAALCYFATTSAASAYTLPLLDYLRALVPGEELISSEILRAWSELRVDLIFNQVAESLQNGANAIATALPASSAIVIALLMAQIFISYFLLRGGELLPSNKD